MQLDEKRKAVVREVFLAVSQARLRANETITELVKQTIRLRDEELKLEEAQEKLRSILNSSED